MLTRKPLCARARVAPAAALVLLVVAAAAAVARADDVPAELFTDLTSDVLGPSSNPALSPDGRLVAFFTFDAHTQTCLIMLVDREAKSSRIVVQSERGQPGRTIDQIHLSDGGESVVFRSDATFNGQTNKEGRKSIWWTDVGFSNVQRIYEPPSTVNMLDQPAHVSASYDIRTVVWEAEAPNGQRNIFFRNETTTVQLTNNADVGAFRPSLSPDGSVLVFASSHNYGESPNIAHSHVWMFPMAMVHQSDAMFTRITGPYEGVSPDVNIDTDSPSVARHGDAVAFVSQYNFEEKEMFANGENAAFMWLAEGVQTMLVGKPEAAVLDPQVTMNGDHVMWVVDDSNGDSQVYRYLREDDSVQQLVCDDVSAYTGDYTISEHGKFVAFSSARDFHHLDRVVMTGQEEVWLWSADVAAGADTQCPLRSTRYTMALAVIGSTLCILGLELFLYEFYWKRHRVRGVPKLVPTQPVASTAPTDASLGAL